MIKKIRYFAEIFARNSRIPDRQELFPGQSALKANQTEDHFRKMLPQLFQYFAVKGPGPSVSVDYQAAQPSN